LYLLNTDHFLEGGLAVSMAALRRHAFVCRGAGVPGMCAGRARISLRLPTLTLRSEPSSIESKTAALLRPVMSQNSAIE
jgi:hypothetical protein